MAQTAIQIPSAATNLPAAHSHHLSCHDQLHGAAPGKSCLGRPRWWWLQNVPMPVMVDDWLRTTSLSRVSVCCFSPLGMFWRVTEGTFPALIHHDLGFSGWSVVWHLVGYLLHHLVMIYLVILGLQQTLYPSSVSLKKGHLRSTGPFWVVLIPYSSPISRQAPGFKGSLSGLLHTSQILKQQSFSGRSSIFAFSSIF